MKVEGELKISRVFRVIEVLGYLLYLQFFVQLLQGSYESFCLSHQHS